MSDELKFTKPLVYSCSGCSSAAQMANYIALKLDRKGSAEMSCIAGVGGNVKKLVRTAKSGRKLIAIDGCPLACAKACLQNHNLMPDIHVDLSRLGVAKAQHEDFDKEQAHGALDQIEQIIRMKYPTQESDLIKNTMQSRAIL